MTGLRRCTRSCWRGSSRAGRQQSQQARDQLVRVAYMRAQQLPLWIGGAGAQLAYLRHGCGLLWQQEYGRIVMFAAVEAVHTVYTLYMPWTALWCCAAGFSLCAASQGGSDIRAGLVAAQAVCLVRVRLALELRLLWSGLCMYTV
jgi:hypothetical protein